MRRMKTLAVIPCNSPHDTTTDLYHADALPMKATTYDNKVERSYSGWTMVDFAARVTPYVCAVVSGKMDLGEQVLLKQLDRYCEPWFIPSDVEIATTPEVDLLSQVEAALTRMSMPFIEDVLVIWPHQIIRFNQDKLDKAGDADVCVVPLGQARKTSSQRLPGLLQAAVDIENNRLSQIVTHSQAKDLDGLMSLNTVVCSVRLPVEVIQQARAAGQSLEEKICETVKGTQCECVDLYQNFY